MKNKLKLFCIVFFLVVMLASFLGAEILTGLVYPDTLSEHIESAQKSVLVAMYFSISGPGNDLVNKLVDSLIDAQKRGVSVKVILENNKLSENKDTFTKLKNAGVKVYFDTPAALTHIKAVVIDERFVFLGSTNWTEAAFKDNNEAAVLMDSPPDAKALTEYINSIEIDDKNPYEVSSDGVSVSVTFLTSPKGGRQLLTNDAYKQFDLYLLLLKKIRETSADEIKIDYDSLAKELGYAAPSELGGYRDDHNYYYEHIHRALKKLRKYGLIEHGNGDVSMPKEGDESFIIPYSYWTLAKEKNLSLRAKYMYLVALYEVSKSTKKPSWFRSQEDMVKLYGISDTTISLGMQELEEKGIIKIMRDKPEPPDFSARKANIYTMLNQR